MRKFLKTGSHMDHAVHVCVNWRRHYPPRDDRSSWDKNQTCDTIRKTNSDGLDFWTAALAERIDQAVGGALLSPSASTPVEPPPEGGDPGVEYAEHRSMILSPGADDAQLWNSDIGEIQDEYRTKQGVTVVNKKDCVELIVPCAAILSKAMFQDLPGSKHYHVMHLFHQVRTGFY
ncbi:hypothetical protein CYMTET_37670 [Cymbomonas tetramitiformis]|uniref:Uncharacterized protein n=1 Tax=Cymbomonas tetramitiformis TaxID=36881 RepID=A0AAE0F7D0_9CHLO|nr:hypothetical protein CYMTET_37670 [Cymbomonas tetramitiformis]